MKRATSIDVARLAGVSQSTVSRVFTPEASVSAETRSRVLAAAAELGYQPNAIARSLSKQNTNIIGIAMGRITSPFHPYVLEKFIQHLQEVGRQALLFSTPPDREVEDALELIMQYQVDGLIITSATISTEMADACANLGIPVVLFNRYVLGARVNAICTDNVEAGRLVANLLLDAGHKRLAYVQGTANASTNLDRQKGFFDRLRERGATEVVSEPGDYTYEAGFAAACRLLNRPDRPDAIFVASDIVALGVLDAARYRFDLRIPEDLSVIGFDDIPAAAWPSYNLTTIRTPVNRMIEATIDLLLARLDEPAANPQTLLFPGALVTRGSARLPAPYQVHPPQPTFAAFWEEAL
ncbi:MAG: LacI family DNA-binding transcriptional regulator [Caldilineales bacterium]|nr:LacI family DNA-binding transcriptional regulator [Caldilineales bacterium]